MNKPIYLDYNASTPLAPEVKELMQKQISKLYGNPSSSHWYGRQMRSAIEKARTQLAELINCSPEEIIFTSGGTEANNLAIRGAAFANRHKGDHIITSRIEHPAVLEVCNYLEKQGFKVTYLPVDKYGIIDLDSLKNSITRATILISIMHANNEVGTIQPLPEIAELCKKNDIIFHSDAAQSLGKIPVEVDALGVDLLSIAGHKIYAPQGVGALYVRKGITLEKITFGADHERNLRPGTENVIEISALGKACEVAKRDLQTNTAQYKKLSDHFFTLLQQAIPGIKLNGHPITKLPNTLNISFPQIKADKLLGELDSIAASAGAACHSDSVFVSHVLKAMQVPLSEAIGAVRFSVGLNTTEREIEVSAREIIDFLKKNIAL